MAGEWKTTLGTLYWDSSTDLPAIGSPVYYKSDSLYHAVLKVGSVEELSKGRISSTYSSRHHRKKDGQNYNSSGTFARSAMEERTSVQVHHMTKGYAISEPTRRSNLLQDARIHRANETLLSGRYSRWEFLSEMGHATETRFCENISFIQGAQRGDWVVDGDNLNPTPENQGLYLDVAGEEMPLVGNLDPHLNVAGEETPPVGNLDPHLNVAGEEMPLVGNLDPHLNVAGEETPPVGNLEQPINVHEEGGAHQTEDWRNVKVYTLLGESIEIQDRELENTVVTEETEEAQKIRQPRICPLCRAWCWNLEGHKAIVPPTPGKNLPPPRNNTQHTGLEQCDTSVSGPGTIRVSGDARPENGPNGLKIISPKSSFVEQQSQRSSWFSYLGSQCWFEDWGGRDVESGTRDLKVGLKGVPFSFSSLVTSYHDQSTSLECLIAPAQQHACLQASRALRIRNNFQHQVFRCRLSSATAKTDFLQVHPKEGHSIWAMPCDIVDDMVDKSLGRLASFFLALSPLSCCAQTPAPYPTMDTSNA
uniref:Uncharacterized protein n=1 Tax=Timema douglasi TaxID=61478 RepID=A0A7R8VBH7_TIMDO|nr:unnamed protein product [Timema douglasi]